MRATSPEETFGPIRTDRGHEIAAKQWAITKLLDELREKKVRRSAERR